MRRSICYSGESATATAATLSKKIFWSQMQFPIPPMREPNANLSLFAILEPSAPDDRPDSCGQSPGSAYV